MLSFVLTSLRLLIAVVRARKDPVFRSAGILVTLTLVSATIFYRKVEGWLWIDAALYSVGTMATIGHPTLAPSTVAGKLFTILFMIVGIGLFIALIARIARALILHKDL
jgi:pheromone shutdown protein TraB